jgi:hypothetical protein
VVYNKNFRGEVSAGLLPKEYFNKGGRMKRLSILMAGLMTACFALAGSIIVHNNNVTISTTGSVLVAKRAARKYLLIVNEDADDTIYIATAPITSTTYASIDCIPLPANYGYYEDNYFVYTSTWYACTSAGSSIIHVMEKE